MRRSPGTGLILSALTWDELESMHAYGELSDAEYNTISGAKDTYARALMATKSSPADASAVFETKIA